MTPPPSLAQRLMRAGNRIVDPVLSRPGVARVFGFVPIRIRYVGRRSGRTFELPAWARRTPDGLRIIVGVSGSKRWWRNFRTPQPLEVRVDGAFRPATAVVHEPRPGRVEVHVTWAPVT